jgi:hypothetical protein
LQVLQALVETLNDVLPRKTTSVAGVGTLGTEEDLGGDDDIATVLEMSATIDIELALVGEHLDGRLAQKAVFILDKKSDIPS